MEKTDLDLTIVEAVRKRFDRPHPHRKGARKKITPWEIPHHIIVP
jgi:hypothetical protein